MQERNTAFVDDQHFESEVRRIARLLWPDASHDRSPKIDGMERDAVIITPDIIFIIEATTSRKRDKIAHDAKKTGDLTKKIRAQGYACKGYLVTLGEPTTDQEGEAKKYQNLLELISFDQLLGRLFDGQQYLQVRLNKPFGSIQNPRSKDLPLDRDVYIPIPIIEDAEPMTHSANSIVEAMRSRSARYTILADFGSGKSMSLREVFFQLRESYIQKTTGEFRYISICATTAERNVQMKS